MGLDGNPSLAFEVHRVQHLGGHLPLGKGAGALQKPVGQRRLPVVNVSDNGKIADECFVAQTFTILVVQNEDDTRPPRPKQPWRLFYTCHQDTKKSRERLTQSAGCYNILRMDQATKTRRGQARAFLKEAVLLLPRLARLLSRLLRDPRVSSADKILVGAVAVYVASPIDVIPDFIPFLGQVDDLFAVSLVLMRLIGEAGEDVVREHWTGSEDLVPWIHKVASLSRVILPERVIRPLDDKFGKSSRQ
jgi:uncharacterized membrane protein YkvA (DUF1232 family)